MKVSVVRGGGVSGLVTVTSVDSQTLSPKDAETLAGMIEEAALDGPEADPSGLPVPDELQVAVTLEDGPRSRTVSWAEHDLPGPLRSLVAWVSAAPERTEEVRPPGETS
jgi:Emfourin